MKKRLLYLILPIVTVILEILPYGAVCNFATRDKTFRVTYSYFSLVPFGYANFAPLLTALVTCAVLVLLPAYAFTGKYPLLKTVKVLLWVAMGLSLCPLLFGIAYFSIVGALISATLLAEQGLLLFTTKK